MKLSVHSIAAAIACCAIANHITPVAAQATSAPPANMIPVAHWAAGEKATYQVQQSARFKRGDSEEIKHVANGLVEIEVLSADSDTIHFRWQRKLDDATWETTLGPWASDAASPLRRLAMVVFRDGLNLEAKFDRRTGTARIANRDEVYAQMKQRVQTVGGNVGSRSQLQTGSSGASLESGTYKPRGSLADKDKREMVISGLARLYLRESQREIDDFVSAFGRDYGIDMPISAQQTVKNPLGGMPVTETGAFQYKPTSPTAAMFSADRKIGEMRGRRELFDDDDDAADGPGEDRFDPSNALSMSTEVQGRFELAVASGWPQRIAFTRVTLTTQGKTGEQTTLRRVYLKK